MKWALIILGALVVVVIVVVAVGYMLPVAHVAASEARFAQPQDAVWTAITDVSAFPSWRADVTAVDTLPSRDGRQRWVEEAGGQRITFEVVESEAPRKLVVRIADPSLPFGGSWTYLLAPSDSGTTLAITENGEVYNPIFRFMARYVFGHTATMEKYLASLGERFGQPVTTE
ncbi:MAG TPA: SRPBCC family protein [Gemmatimonadaceae bacterium]|nr:SRPBCC family protein [Gemmatimonadaceae bacterium]